jgi:hypothetical protein
VHYQPVDIVRVLELDDELDATDDVGEIHIKDMASVTTEVPLKAGSSVTWNNPFMT